MKNAKSKHRITLADRERRTKLRGEPPIRPRNTITKSDRLKFQAALLPEPLNLPDPDPLNWLGKITADRETHLRLAESRGRLEWLIGFGDRREKPEEWRTEVLAREIGLFLFMTSPRYFAQKAFYFVMNERQPSQVRAAIRDLSIKVGEGIAGLAGYNDITEKVDRRDGKSYRVSHGAAWKIAIDRPLIRSLSRYGSGEKGVARNRWESRNPPHNEYLWPTIFLLAAADEVATVITRIRRCDGCPSIYIANDPRSRFHSKKCGVAKHVADWRAAKELKAEAQRRKARKHSKR